jgi:adenylate cyclase
LGREIERKFLVIGEGWREGVTERREIRQFYLARTDRATMRVRITGGRTAQLTVKGTAKGAVCAEYEWDIPLADAQALEELRSG